MRKKQVICNIHCPKTCNNDLKPNASDTRHRKMFQFPGLFVSMWPKVVPKVPSSCISLLEKAVETGFIILGFWFHCLVHIDLLFPLNFFTVEVERHV